MFRLPIDEHPSRRRILVVDRGSDAALSQTALLQLQGFDATSTDSAAAAVSLAQEIPHDVVLLDLDLTEGNPYDVIRALRSVRIPPTVVILTAHTTAAIRQAAADAGASAYLLKPADPQRLADLLHRFGESPTPMGLADR